MATVRSLTRLDPDEAGLFDALVNNRFGENVRLKQERISFARVREALQSLVGDTPHLLLRSGA
jgi:hypothetical protein